jgi:hypothetical protein
MTDIFVNVVIAYHASMKEDFPVHDDVIDTCSGRD